MTATVAITIRRTENAGLSFNSNFIKAGNLPTQVSLNDGNPAELALMFPQRHSIHKPGVIQGMAPRPVRRDAWPPFNRRCERLLRRGPVDDELDPAVRSSSRATAPAVLPSARTSRRAPSLNSSNGRRVSARKCRPRENHRTVSIVLGNLADEREIPTFHKPHRGLFG
jgi:hypothetical protein